MNKHESNNCSKTTVNNLFTHLAQVSVSNTNKDVLSDYLENESLSFIFGDDVKKSDLPINMQENLEAMVRERNYSPSQKTVEPWVLIDLLKNLTNKQEDK